MVSAGRVDDHQAPASGASTLVIDLGGSRVRTSVVSADGTVSDPEITSTPYPMEPADLVAMVRSRSARLPHHDRVTLGFPGFVRDGRVLTAPHFVTADGPGSAPHPARTAAWTGFDLAAAIAGAVERPTIVANDADLHGAGVVGGAGLELVITLGTGVGTALFSDGRLCPHLELAHHPLAGGETYNVHLGDAARRRVGDGEWRERVAGALARLDDLLRPDTIWLGGGNARRAHPIRDSPPHSVVHTIDPLAALPGGARLWVLLERADRPSAG